MLDSNAPLEFVRTYKVAPAQLWKAITDHGVMIQWYFDNIPDFKAEVGFHTKFDVQAPSQVFVHNWKVTEVDEDSKIAYEWTFDNIVGRGSTTWEVSPHEEGSQLKLTDRIHEGYPQDVPEFKRESAVGGWNYFLDERLGPFLSSIGGSPLEV